MAVERVDRVLHHELGHDLPGVPCSGVRVMRAVNLRHVAPFDELFALRRVHKRAYHVDVAVDDVILRILMAAVNAFLREHDRDIRSRNAADIAVIIDGPADLVFD
ncbi:hypothetical protein SDC9_107588 [bioreactor metagenome]|uniref:Uncharacterized protein n=1 Tax=bioreactor metagenome TaxID=1076179 RepID=A0A645B6Q3_9ZZZZ